jgi:hypothetical protein
VFTLFKTSRTHMFLACSLEEPAAAALPATGVVPVRSQQNFLAKAGKAITGAPSPVALVFLIAGRCPPAARMPFCHLQNLRAALHTSQSC